MIKMDNSNRGWLVGRNSSEIIVLRCLISNDSIIVCDFVEDFTPMFLLSISKITPVELFLNRCCNGLYLNLCDGFKVKRKSDCAIYDVDESVIREILRRSIA